MSCAALIFSFYFAQAQAPEIKWEKSFGGSSIEVVYALTPTSDGNFVFAGYSNSDDGDVSGNHGDHDFWIVKIDTSGNLIWQVSLGGSGSDQARSITETADGGFIVSGFSYSNDFDVSSNHGMTDTWVVKINTLGIIEWQKCLGGTEDEESFSVRQTNDGGYIVVSASASNDGDVSGNHGNLDYWIAKLDAVGNIEWQKSLGGTSVDFPFCIRQTKDGGYIASGWTYSSNGDVSGIHGSSDYWVVKLDSVGVIQWQKCLGGSDIDVAGYSIEQTIDGGYILSGNASSLNFDVTGNHGGNDYWIVKLDTVGNIQWQKSLGGVSDDQSFSVKQTIDGGYIVAGATMSNDGDVSGNHGWYDFWILKLTIDGDIEWQKCLGGTEVEGGICVITQTSYGSYIVAGHSMSIDGDVTGNHGEYDIWVAMLERSIPTGVISTTNSDYKVYPNPFTDYIVIEGNFQMVTITDVIGRVRLVGIEGNNFNTKNFLPGMYIISIIKNNGTYVSKKIQKM